MSTRISIILDAGTLSATLDDSPTARSVTAELPLQGVVSRWGEEIYFSIPVHAGEAPDARQDMAVGEIGYWPAGPALCIFFGPTPASVGEEPRAYSNVNPLGRIDGDKEVARALLGTAKDGQSIRVIGC